MKIVIKFSCGLGNQLFQYAFLQSLKESYPMAEILGDISSYKIAEEHFGFDMPLFFDVDLETISYEEAKRYSPTYLLPVNTPKCILNLYHKIQFTPIGTIINFFSKKKSAKNAVCLGSDEPNVVYDYMYQLNTEYEKTFYLSGYWQNNYYLERCKNFHNSIRFREELLSDTERNQLSYIRNTNCVSVHVRRGDYLMYPEYNICSLDYYYRALEIIRERMGEIPVIYFSDDAEFVKDNFELKDSDRIIANGCTRGGCDMFLMSNCTAHIIANSSFSFWGAYFDPCKESIVVAPKIFKRTKQFSYSFKVPEHWITLDV